MGCDIHIVVERRWHDPPDGNPRWVGLHTFPYLKVSPWAHQLGVAYGSDIAKKLDEGVDARSIVRNRDYDLFGALAGVRRSGPSPRGMPEDASDLALSFGDHGDHSHTWYYADEAMPIFLRHTFEGVKRLVGGETDHAGRPRTAEGLAYLVFNDFFVDCYADPEEEHNTLRDYRLIISFDS